VSSSLYFDVGCSLTYLLLELATDADLKLYDKMIAEIKKIAPDFERPLTPEESVKLQLEVIKNVTVKDSGTLISHHGDNKNWL
jgi:hypothetical protein